MVVDRRWAAGWAVWAAVGVAAETAAVWLRRDGVTLSAQVNGVLGHAGRARPVVAAAMAGFLIWLTVHLTRRGNM